MKRFLSFLLVLVLIAGLLAVGASAAGATVMVSKQNLRADGVTIACEKYNIDGSNYFKLRDVAYLVNGTGSQFSVGYDEVKRVISIVTGEEYVPNGSEMDLSGGDKSASAVPSSQTVLINGKERSDLSVYNIGGNNYFKLRDLGTALGFHVDYDQPSNTAVIVSKRAGYPAQWLTEERLYRSNEGEASRYVTVYSEDGRILSYRSEGVYSTEEVTYRYDELNRMVERYSETTWADDEGYDDIYWSRETLEYDIWGNLKSEITEESGDVITENHYTYDEYGRNLTQIYRSNYGETTTVYAYDENGNVSRYTYIDDDGETTVSDYVRDADGNILRRTTTDAQGNVTAWEEYTYDEYGREIKSIYSYDGGNYQYVYTYTYNAQGQMTHSETNSAYYYDIVDCMYDKGDRLVRTECRNTYGSYTILYQYDEEDREIRSEFTNDEGSRRVVESIYAGDRLAKVVEDDDGTVTVTEYTYDDAARKMTADTTVTYPLPESMTIYDDKLSLSVGNSYYLYVSYEPYNAAYESVTWTSSDPKVATVDEYGCVTAVGLGTAVITAVSESGLTATSTVTVTDRVLTFTVEPESLNVKYRYTKTILCTVTVEGYDDYYLNYRNLNNDIISAAWDADWSDDGTCINLYVTGLSVGEATLEIFATSEKYGDPVGESIFVTVYVVE